MDFIILSISKKFLKKNINDFINILKNEKYEYWQEQHFLKNFPLKFKISLAAIFEKKIIGYIIASQKSDVAYIHKFMVREGYRGKGIGNKLLISFEYNIASMNLLKIGLAVYSENNEAIKFYQKNGFKINKEKKDNNGKSLYIMLKEIQNEDCNSPA